MKRFLAMLFFIPFACYAQVSITGKLVNATDKSDVADASVFLSNATIGNKSAADGSFVLRGVRPGQYELVITVVGYETYRREVLVASDNISLPDIGLTPKITSLAEVNITPDPAWERNYDVFKEEFLGTSAMALRCTILNPETIDLEWDKNALQLTGSSSGFVEIDNKALGYHIKYLLSRFIKDSKISLVYYEGSALFEEMKGTAREKERWEKNRQLAYEGSSMQFLRAAIGNNITGYGFEVLRLIRKPNPDAKGFNDKYIQTLVNVPLTPADFTVRTDKKSLFALKFTDCLYIMYTKKREDDRYNSTYRLLHMPNYLTTIASFTGPYALFDTNGVILNPSAITFEGNWGKSRVAEMLPVDYTPKEK
ncbi:carboxypeptidase-like regulatory domain-containing protein [Mucilaginibacter sp. 14171R-50]|uniref:carboxypeptidase-like regulatory domain-containing protein n=1 Tax=Mucilaginibacter sp. 14171R-50 TaxID=2703789 RepID=UPI00138C8D7A|nr:carboxypeptidase-like regulatory domain-containing protein [Mucilaginibacter sp. 14171R-50]QHS55665.1 carboxypeptidase-like regulatory domain-containing protein [Mucilaginibacter sp. 14171R-50]